MKNRKLIREFAKDHGIKIVGPLYLLVDRSDRYAWKWMWYRDFAGNYFLILPWCGLIEMYNHKKSICIKSSR